MSYNWGGTDAIWLGRLVGTRKIYHNEHGFNVDEAKSTAFRKDLIRFFLYRLASKIIVVSHELKSMMATKFKLDSNKVILIPNGINTNHFCPNSYERECIRKELGFGTTEFVIGFSGRLDPVKNFFLMASIFEECLSKSSDFQLLIVGEGEERENIQKEFKKRNLNKNVHLVGPQKDVLPYLRAMDLYLLTSFREQMPLTILEAMAVGLPVAATNVGEIPYMIDHLQNGIIFERMEDPKKIARMILDLNESTKYPLMQKSAREKVVSCFQENLMLATYFSLLQNLN